MPDKADEKAEAPKPSMIKKLMLPMVAALGLVGATLGGLSFMGVLSFAKEDPAVAAADGEESASAETSKAAGSPAFFFSFYPDLLVNFTADGRPHYLKASIDVMSRDEDAIKGVEEYHAIMRNNILILFQQVKYERVKGQEGMESMQQIALDEIKRVLKKYHGNNDVEGVYFTSFVVQ